MELWKTETPSMALKEGWWPWSLRWSEAEDEILKLVSMRGQSRPGDMEQDSSLPTVAFQSGPYVCHTNQVPYHRATYLQP